MTVSPFELMQRTVDIVHRSQHPVNKIAATLAGKDFALSYNNYWPDPIRQNIGTETRIGNSSGTVHAETACLIHAPVTKGAALFVTDLPCPNCTKYMAEAGINRLYIDHKGFDKDYARRRGDDFEELSLRICQKAGIAVYKLFRKEEKLKPILEVAADYSPPLEKPARAIERTGGNFRDHVEHEAAFYHGRPFAVGWAHEPEGKKFILSAEVHPVIGYTAKTIGKPEGKYSYELQPINRLIMTAARKGLKLEPAHLFSSRVPSARELVNMVGAGLDRLIIGNPAEARDEHGLQAKVQLEQAGIIGFSTF